jgi:hypothetical protein
MEFRASNLFKQLQIRTAYTWSKNLDNVSEIFATGSAGNTLFAAQNPFQSGNAERSLSGLNIPHALSVSFTENLPFFKEQHGWMGHILGGWAFSGSYILASGQGYTPQQGLAEAANTALGNYYDLGYVGGFVGLDTARPFFGSASAPAGNVGIYAFDACLTLIGAANRPGGTGPLSPICALPQTQLISYNALNLPGSGSVGACLAQFTGGSIGGQTACITNVTNANVRFIINARTAQSVFGTPFGNVPRNALTDAISNRLDASIFKNLKLGEKSNFEMRMSATNALNHFNFGSVDPNLEDAGIHLFGAGFANPAATAANGRVVSISGRFTF